MKSSSPLHSTGFRFFVPLVCGLFSYLFILMYYNEVASLKDQFFTLELLICVVLAMITQEVTRIIILRPSFSLEKRSWISLIFYLTIPTIVVLLWIIALLQLYYRAVVGYAPEYSELRVFMIIFGVIAIMYTILYSSYQNIQQAQKLKLSIEEKKREEMKHAFLHFQESIHPSLLLSSLESIILKIKNQAPGLDDFVDALSTLYRYLLSKKKRALVPLSEELVMIPALEKVLSAVPSVPLTIDVTPIEDCLIASGTLLSILEKISHSSIHNSEKDLKIKIEDLQDDISINYTPFEKLSSPLELSTLSSINHRYKIYCDRLLTISRSPKLIDIRIPKLILTHEDSYH